MLLYADDAEVAAYTGQPAPLNVAVLLRHASLLVRHATRAALYDTIPSGLPSDPDVMDAFRDATCAQVEMWAAAGVDPTAAGIGADGAVASESRSIGGATVAKSYAAGAPEARMAAASSLCPAAALILGGAGLTGGHPL